MSFAGRSALSSWRSGGTSLRYEGRGKPQNHALRLGSGTCHPNAIASIVGNVPHVRNTKRTPISETMHNAQASANHFHASSRGWASPARAVIDVSAGGEPVAEDLRREALQLALFRGNQHRQREHGVAVALDAVDARRRRGRPVPDDADGFVGQFAARAVAVARLAPAGPATSSPAATPASAGRWTTKGSPHHAAAPSRRPRSRSTQFLDERDESPGSRQVAGREVGIQDGQCAGVRGRANQAGRAVAVGRQ